MVKKIWLLLLCAACSGGAMAETRLMLKADKKTSALGEPLTVEVKAEDSREPLSSIHLDQLKQDFNVYGVASNVRTQTRKGRSVSSETMPKTMSRMAATSSIQLARSLSARPRRSGSLSRSRSDSKKPGLPDSPPTPVRLTSMIGVWLFRGVLALGTGLGARGLAAGFAAALDFPGAFGAAVFGIFGDFDWAIFAFRPLQVA